MKGGCLMTSSNLLAEWNHDPTCSSRTCLGCSLQDTASLFGGSYTDWPQSGTWDDTGLWRQPKWVPPTSESVGSVLPTPTKSDGMGGPGSQRGGGDNLRTAVTLLPTPTKRDYKGPESEERHNLSPWGASSAPASHVAQFGRYWRAVDRWERITGRRSPDPLLNGQLNAHFVEWMMGYDEGWVTSVGRRRPQIRALGNAVVPQQAAAAWGVFHGH